ncbi:hypothetical protein BHE74_00049118, partial [Ensete ventricosum]
VAALGCLLTGAKHEADRPLRAGRGRPSIDHWQQPLQRGRGRLPPLAGAMLQPTTLGRLPLLSGRGWAPPPCGLALAAAADGPYAGGLAAAGLPCKVAGRGHAPLPLARASFTAKTQQERIE